MSDEASEALEASITKWEGYVEVEWAQDAEPHDCPLCDLFYIHTAEIKCEGCPVFEKTDKPFCYDTPYYAAVDAWDDWLEFDTDEDRDNFRAKGRAEVRFLKSCRKGDTK